MPPTPAAQILSLADEALSERVKRACEKILRKFRRKTLLCNLRSKSSDKLFMGTLDALETACACLKSGKVISYPPRLYGDSAVIHSTK